MVMVMARTAAPAPPGGRAAAPARPRVPGVVVLPRRALLAHRAGLLLVSVVPLAGVGVAAWSLWGRGLRATDAVIAGGLYAVTGLGVSVGFHRLFAHKAFEASGAVRVALAVAGSMAIEMSVVDWVATHRRHHAFSDRPGDPHSPHLQAERGWRGILKGLWHAHMGWLFSPERTSRERWAPDLLKDPGVATVDRAFPALVALSFVAPALLGLAATRSLAGAASAFLWGGLVRIFVLHHVTFSINSICHFFGSRPFDTRERSTNNAWLALLSFGESWHNNHHAFPSSAFFGLRPWQVDLGGLLVRALEGVGLARRVRRPDLARAAG
jgi:stearoyl-CoA desaturase (delta-9 desaturase)